VTIGANQKTTISAAVSAAASFVLFASQPPLSIHFPQWIAAVAMFAAVGGLAALGINAKDSHVTGGDVQQAGLVKVADPVVVASLAAASPPAQAHAAAEPPGKALYVPNPRTIAKW
jgi:hypothetical protein